MKKRLITISYTGLNAGGGVPKFNRDLHAAFPDRERLHFCWADCPHDAGSDIFLQEWQKAQVLNWYLIQSRKIRPFDVIVADGFWATGLETFPLAVSHSHGIWGHVTKDDIEAGKDPENPHLHAAQVTFRRNWIKAGKHITAVSDFIAEQMRLQWGFKVDRVINNGVDLDHWKPLEKKAARDRLLIIHGVNDRSNSNKGWDHIEYLISQVSADVMSLDEFHVLRQGGFVQTPEGIVPPSQDRYQKNLSLAEADIVVHPSGYEGNSMFVAEALSCGVPIVGYDVGFLWCHEARMAGFAGTILNRNYRSPAYTADGVKSMISEFVGGYQGSLSSVARRLAERKLDIKLFRQEWRDYVESIENA